MARWTYFERGSHFSEWHRQYDGLAGIDVDFVEVCPECYEPKHPQLEPPYSSADAEAIENPRPKKPQAVVVVAGDPNDTFFNSNGMQPSTISRPLLSLTRVGNVTIEIS